MKVENNLTEDLTKEFLTNKKNITFVIDYLEALRNAPPSQDVNNDAIGLLIKSLSVMTKFYFELHDLPIVNSQLQLQNYIQSLEIERLKKEIKLLTNERAR